MQVRAGLNIGLSGIPWWTTDIGGFYGGDSDRPLSASCSCAGSSTARSARCSACTAHREPHDCADTMLFTGGPNEVWSFGDEAYEIIRDCCSCASGCARTSWQQMKLAQDKGMPPMRPLFFDFPADEACARVDDQFLFGPDILVAPVLQEGARSREVYLPAGAAWTDAWSGQPIAGGHAFHGGSATRADTGLSA